METTTIYLDKNRKHSNYLPDGIMIVYAYNRNKFDGVWIYGAYEDHMEGFDKMTEMQESHEYGYLHWTNNVIKITKMKNEE
jgi:hypothetical protein